MNYLCDMHKVILLLCTAILLYSCGTQSKKSSLTEKFSSDSLHLFLQFPSDWEVLKNPKDPQSVAFVQKAGNKQDSYQENIVFWLEEMPMSVTDSVYLQASVTQLKIANPELNIIKKGKVKLGNYDFSSFSFDMQGKKNVAYAITGYCLVIGQRGYNFSCTALKPDMPQYLPLFQDIISTFKPL